MIFNVKKGLTNPTPFVIINLTKGKVIKTMRKEVIPTKEEMCDKVVQMFGLESEWTIWFFELAEELDDDKLFNAFVIMTCKGVWNDEEK